MWNNSYPQHPDVLIDAIHACGREASRLLNRVSGHAPIPPLAGTNGRSHNLAPNPTWAGFNDRPTQYQAAAPVYSQTSAGAYGAPPAIRVPVSNSGPLILTVYQATDYYLGGPYGRSYYQNSVQLTYDSPLYDYRGYPYHYPLYSAGSYSHPQQYAYPNQYQHGTYAYPYHHAPPNPEDSYENFGYSGEPQYPIYRDETNDFPGYPGQRQSSRLREYFGGDSPPTEEASSSSSSDPPGDGSRSFGCAFCCFRAENESVFRNHNNSCKAPNNENANNGKKPSNAK